MKILKVAAEFENRKHSLKNTSDRIRASREAKEIILSLNELYKMGHDPKIMDMMKRLTIVKRRIEKRLNYKPLVI